MNFNRSAVSLRLYMERIPYIMLKRINIQGLNSTNTEVTLCIGEIVDRQRLHRLRGDRWQRSYYHNEIYLTDQRSETDGRKDMLKACFFIKEGVYKIVEKEFTFRHMPCLFCNQDYDPLAVILIFSDASKTY